MPISSTINLEILPQNGVILHRFMLQSIINLQMMKIKTTILLFFSIISFGTASSHAINPLKTYKKKKV